MLCISFSLCHITSGSRTPAKIFFSVIIILATLHPREYFSTNFCSFEIISWKIYFNNFYAIFFIIEFQENKFNLIFLFTLICLSKGISDCCECLQHENNENCARTAFICTAPSKRLLFDSLSGVLQSKNNDESKGSLNHYSTNQKHCQHIFWYTVPNIIISRW